jgi:hypothetical protein
MEHMASFSRSSASETSQRSAFSITQRSIAGVSAYRSAAAMKLSGETMRPDSSRMRSNSS